MARKIRTNSLADLSILSAYLHDSTFKHDEAALMDGVLSFGIDRPGYEYDHRRKALWVIPVVTYPWVPAHIELARVRELQWIWHNNRDEVQDVRGNLLEIEGGPRELRFHGDYFELVASLEEFEFFQVTDAAGPMSSGGVSDFFGRTVKIGQAIERLRVDA